MSDKLETIGRIDEIDGIVDGSIRNQDPSGDIPQGSILVVRGWAALVKDSERSSGLFAMIDDGPPLETIYGFERLDVARGFGDVRFTRTGFRAALSTLRLAVGPHTLRIAFRDADGCFTSVGEPATFTIKPNRHAFIANAKSAMSAVGAVDALGIDDRLLVSPVPAGPSDTIVARGWIIDRANDGVVSSVYCVIGGRVFRGVYGFLREDVARAQGDERYAPSGFTIRVPVELVPPGRHTARIRAIGADGETLLESVTFEVDVAGNPSMLVPAPGVMQTRLAIDECYIFDVNGRVRIAGQPANLLRGDRLFVRGWAIDEINDGLVRAVHLSVDNVTSIPAITGLDRRDVAAHFGRPDLAECGFTGIIETTSLPAGDHVVTVRIIDQRGSGAYETPASVAFTLRDA